MTEISEELIIELENILDTEFDYVEEKVPYAVIEILEALVWRVDHLEETLAERGDDIYEE